MSKDKALVEKLRSPKEGWTGDALCVSSDVAEEAADRIEALEAACRALDENAPIDSEWGYCGCCHKARDHESYCPVTLARAALAKASVRQT